MRFLKVYKCSTSNEEMTKDTEGTVEFSNLQSSCDQFMASAYFKNCKINININKWVNANNVFFRTCFVTSY